MKKSLLIFLSLFLLLSFTTTGYAKLGIISTSQLAKMMKTDKNLVIIDARKKAFYEKGHIPGAIHLEPISKKLFTKFDNNPNPFAVVVSNKQLEKVLSSLGIKNDSDCVVYTGSAKRFGIKGSNPAFALTSATRVIAVLYFAGVKNVYYLNGGFEKWKDEGRPVQIETPQIKPSHFVIKRNRELVFAEEDLVRWAVRHPREIQLIDARMPPEYKGEVSLDMEKKFGVTKLGHIKGAKSLYVALLMKKVKNYYLIKSKKEIIRIMRKAGINPFKPMISYCHIGYWGSGIWFVAHTVLNNALAWDYDGSLVKACADPEIPFKKGNRP